MMNPYALITDNGSDLPLDYLSEHEIGSLQLSYTIDDVTYKAYDQDPKDFYAAMRAGKMPITAQVNVDDAISFFEPILQSGRDIFYLAFSSGLSGTYNSACVARDELLERYPDRKLVVVDSLCATLGQGLLVHKVREMREGGATIEELEAYCLEHRDHVIHIVGVDDLMHLHRGGRVSKTSAIAGSLLGVKPLITVNNAGKLVAAAKARGRKQQLNMIVDMADKMRGETKPDFIMVSHSDCLEDAHCLEALAKKRFKVKHSLISYIGTVIGAHAGPGTVVLALYGDSKE